MRTWIVQTVRTLGTTAAIPLRRESQWEWPGIRERPIHLVAQFFAQEFRGAPDHEPCNEHSEDCKGQHPIQAAARTAEDHFTELHQQRRAAVAEKRQRDAGAGDEIRDDRDVQKHLDRQQRRDADATRKL